MKLVALSVAAAAAAALAGGQAFAHPAQAHQVKTLQIVMHDPGCHWFQIGGKYKVAAAVRGPVKLWNVDEAALKVAGAGKTRLIPVGKQLLVGRGHYVITMVGQAPDDNHLKLSVS